MHERDDKGDPARQLVVIADQEASVRQFLADLLKREGFSVLQASNGREAITILDEHTAALLITDVVMEGMDGFELMSKVRTHHSKVPVIAMSGTGRVAAKTYLHIAKRFGAQATLEKPFRVGDFLEAVFQILGGQRVTREGESDILL